MKFPQLIQAIHLFAVTKNAKKKLLLCKAESEAISKRGCFELWIDKLLHELTKVVHFCE